MGGSDCPTSVEEVKWIGFKLLWPASQATIGKAFGGAKERALCVPGDVVFYRTDKATTRKPPITHVALVTAPGQITHARGTKYGVVTTADDIYDGKICAICRYEPQNDVSPADKPAAQTVCVTGGSVNVRTGPGTSYGILTTVHKDDILHALEMSNGWTRVELASGKSGWVSDKYLRRT
ncbi:MAG: SH3 domain-containing protein [Christensenellaceae bacterium]|nr:SH3 domain-containing protein [Christensenellaceae bacterium]